MMTKTPTFFILLVLALSGSNFMSTPSFAQASSRGGPIEISANDLVYDPEAGFSTLVGNASVSQDGAVLRAPRIRITYVRSANGSNDTIDKVFTEGETFYVTPTEKIRGDRAVFDTQANIVQFFGNVVAVQGQNVLKGSMLTINTKTRASTMRGLDGRVKAVIFPNDAPPSKGGTSKR
ncbi:LptA/OstA family protein [Candidatus Phycosocius spiralis]|uniref:Organic solvent tolerance-like N-terminal domain-containing protein n=1 Tax=Candidatus Phycosocius spiralis TaxID=2815099 RepID=A0ABQ4PTX1_9PROT|nr:LptA/OstA family protein [Candidatus Phycosocius spiralis]GIU66439.1 hypothetical protein PsB1_0593 [Candidatus Phycosocius spiralis]